jgi:FMN-dependent NADH-azoreductase
MSTLFINACIRPESRTLKLAKELLSKLEKETGAPAEVLNLEDENLRPLSNTDIAKRDKAAASGDFSDSLFRHAKQFAEADIIVMAAPYWDLSFPALVKLYFEAITVCGIAFRYTPEGYPQGLCKAKKFYYVTTSGGYIGEYDFGFQYAKALVTKLYGIPAAECIKQEGLDIANN